MDLTYGQFRIKVQLLIILYRVLSAAALATSGDVLEMGTGFFSTPMLHDIVASKV